MTNYELFDLAKTMFIVAGAAMAVIAATMAVAAASQRLEGRGLHVRQRATDVVAAVAIAATITLILGGGCLLISAIP